MKVVDSTRYVTALYCRRKRYWLTEYGGRGIVLTSSGEALLYGIALHAGLEALAHGKPFDEARMLAEADMVPLSVINALTPDGYLHWDELRALLYGHLRCYQDYVLPSLQSRFNFHGIEQEITFPLTGDLQYCTRLDVILESKQNGLLYNLNYKSTAYPNDLLLNEEHSIQLMMETEAARIHMGANITGSIVIGFDKGAYHPVSDKEKERGLTGKRLISPLTYAYAKGDDPWDPRRQYAFEYKTGWKRTPTWIAPLSPEHVWEHLLPEPVKRSRSIELPPIYPDAEKVAALKRQIISTEMLMTHPAAADDLDVFYPQNFELCNRDSGYTHCNCPYKTLCIDGEDPEYLIGGLYKWRDANHPCENALLAEV